MSAREWKPGDVAVVWINDRRQLALVRPRQEAGIKGALEFAYVDGGFNMVDDLAPGWNARPLLVIDPEDREQVEALLAAMPWSDRTIDRLQANLRSLITPPKPEEPTDPAVRVITGGNDVGRPEINGPSREWARSTAGRWVCLTDHSPGELTWDDLVHSFGPVGFTGVGAAS